MKPLIAIPSCHANGAARAACKSTWIAKWGNLVDIRFFIGKPKRRNQKDTIYLDVLDDYNSLPLKVKAVHAWALANGYTHVFKCDDDTFVHVPRLLASGYQREYYVGARRSLFFAQGGAGYWLNAEAMRVLAKCPDHDWAVQKAEDIAVGFLLQGKLPLTKDTRYVDTRMGQTARETPTPKNEQITYHKTSPELMVEILKQFK